MSNIVIIDDEDFYLSIAKFAFEGYLSPVCLYTDSDAFFTSVLLKKTPKAIHWILVDWLGPVSDTLEEDFVGQCKKLGIRAKIVLWSNLMPKRADLKLFDGFLSKDQELNYESLSGAIFKAARPTLSFK